MQISKQSKDNMLFFLNDAETYLKKIGPYQQRRLDIILGKLYKDIYNSDTYVDTLVRRGCLKAKRARINNLSDIPTSTLLDSQYFPFEIQNYINTHSKSYLHYSCKILNKKVNIYIVLSKDMIGRRITKYDNMAKKMFTWLRMAFLYAPTMCGKSLKIILYYTPLEKKLPPNLIDILGTRHCNSAVTTSCSSKGEIVIYRKEEWFKVFIHESFHVLGLDFSAFPMTQLNYKMKKLFPIESEIKSYEAYSEFWATILNCLFCSYELLDADDKLNERDFLLYSEFLLQFERIFALFQCNKILYFMGMNYNNLYLPGEVSFVARKYLYKEDTNVFAYYILKNILLYNYVSFLEWCDKHNINMMRFDKYDNNMNKFYDFVSKKYDDPKFILDMTEMRKFLLKSRRENNKHPIQETLRMTICEME